MDYILYIGIISSILLAITPFAQVFTTIRIRSAKDISIYFLILQIIASSGFITYGVLINDIWIIIPNASLVLTSIIMMFFKYYFNINLNNNVINL